MKNPPMVCYYLAGASLLVGWSEAALHAAMLLPAIAVVLGTFQLARELEAPPALAAATLATPVFLLSATTLMCDVLMLAFYVWAVVLWLRGIRSGRTITLIAAVLLVAGASLSKYFGVTLLPLLGAYAVWKLRRPGIWIAALALPVVVLGAYHLWSAKVYGRGLLLDAFSYAGEKRSAGGSAALGAVLTGLSFTGGCCATVALLILVRARRNVLIAAGAALIAIFAALLAIQPFPRASLRAGDAVQVALWMVAGAGILAWTIVALRRNRSAETGLLVLWVLGTFCFAVFVNWSVAARSILPMAPAAAILATRGLDLSRGARRAWAVVALGGGLALLVAWADFSLARTASLAADRTIALASFARENPARTIWFTGHWGFQAYAEARGAVPFDRHKPMEPGDVFITPSNNSNLITLPRGAARRVGTVELQPLPFLTTMHKQSRAGFYTDLWGPLPFTFGPVPAERYDVDLMTRAISPTSGPTTR
jgi:4-amino-4-deoxy-L-arabinose transferase-like glycosyltransferase